MPDDQRKPTEADRLYELSPRQFRALELVLSGNKDGEVASAVGVTRQTVNEWRRRHPAFRAALTALVSDRIDAMRHRVAELQREALEVIGRAIDEGDVRTALGYLRLGLDVARMNGPDDAEEVLIAELPRRDPVLEMLDRSEAPTAEDRARLENSIASRIRAAATQKDGLPSD